MKEICIDRYALVAYYAYYYADIIGRSLLICVKSTVLKMQGKMLVASSAIAE